jgi:hypothetical protein
VSLVGFQFLVDLATTGETKCGVHEVSY